MPVEFSSTGTLEGGSGLMQRVAGFVMRHTDVGKTWQKLFLIYEHARKDSDFQFTSLAHFVG